MYTNMNRTCWFCKETHAFDEMLINKLHDGINFGIRPLVIRPRFDLEFNQIDLQVARTNQPKDDDDNLWSHSIPCNFCPVCGRHLIIDKMESPEDPDEAATSRREFMKNHKKWVNYGIEDSFLYLDDWIEQQKESVANTDIQLDPKILEFIYKTSIEPEMAEYYSNGMCYYFAMMLKEMFPHGEVCWLYKRSHIVFVDRSKEYPVAYDSWGFFCDYNDKELIPFDKLDEINQRSFKHDPAVENMSKEEIQANNDALIKRLNEEGYGV